MDEAKSITTPSIADAKQYIDAINFSMIIEKMVQYQGWLRKEAETVCELYRRFLYLNKKYGRLDQPLPPSEDIDEFWHNHILDTKKYQKDCLAIFGQYFNHYPYLGLGIDDGSNLDDLASAYQKTQQFYKEEFGGYIYQIRGLKSKVLAFLKSKWAIKPKRFVAAEVES